MFSVFVKTISNFVCLHVFKSRQDPYSSFQNLFDIFKAQNSKSRIRYTNLKIFLFYFSVLIGCRLNVKVLLLVRDPRGTMQSRKHRVQHYIHFYSL